MNDSVAQRLNGALEGRYVIERELGEGGMATVFLAKDLKHNRSVALKVLKPELAAVVGAERFLAEIETTANLQHPHVLPLYDSGEADTFLFYVMPYLEGETLRDRIDRERQLPVEEAVRIATAVANALDYAHRNGVVHRDIKPANILLQDGEPVVADFGIALALGVAGGTRLTETGLSVGTPFYMSPEQATGDQSVGAASDIYSLSCVLYEMLIGEPPFLGNTAQAVLGKIISGEPVRPTGVRASIPSNVDAAIRKALEKLPADRFTSAQAFTAALKDPAFRHAGASDVAESRQAYPRGTVAALGSLTVALVVALAWMVLRPEPPQPVTRYGIAFAPGQELVDEVQLTFDIAPDDSWIVYVGPGELDGQLWIKARDRYEASPLPGTDGARGPSVSPDGEWISFVAEGQLRRIPSAGGPAITLVDSVSIDAQTPSAWLDDGTLTFVDPQLNSRRVPVNGGGTEVILSADSLLNVYAAPLPGSGGVLLGRCSLLCIDVKQVWVADLETGEAELLATDAVWSRYVDTGHVLYTRSDGTLFALPFDPQSLEATGAAVPVLQGIKMDQGAAPDLALSLSGTLLMMVGAGIDLGPGWEAVWVDRRGGVTLVDPEWRFELARNLGWSLSPDGTRLAIGLDVDGNDDIWIKELDDGPEVRLTFAEDEQARPVWTPDGRSVLYFSYSAGSSSDVWTRRGDGTTPEEQVLTWEKGLWEGALTPDGQELVMRAGSTTDGRDIVRFRPGVDGAAVALLASGDYDEMAPALSPDGRWLAYVSDESGRPEVYARPYPDVESGRWPVSTDGGYSPRWAHSGGELFYLTEEDVMMSAAVATAPTFSVTERNALFSLGVGYRLSSISRVFDVGLDDERFILVRSVGAARQQARQIILVQNWMEELKETLAR